MTETELGTIRGPSQRIREIITHTALAGRGDPFHSDVYVSVTPGQVDTVVASDGNTLLTYCTFTDAALSEIDVTEDDADSTQAIINVADFLNYLDFASDGGEVELALRGEPDSELASVMEVTGALNTRVMLPASDSILDDVPINAMFDRFDSENNFQGKTGALETNIETDVEQIQRLIEIVNYDAETEFYPITVEEDGENDDGDMEYEFALDIGRDTGRNAVWGEMSATSVTSDSEVQNNYHQGFEPVFDTLGGDVRLQTASGGAPLAVVQERDGVTLRHVIANVS
jgi:hypothetical protein